jgi:hypothetical protein
VSEFSKLKKMDSPYKATACFLFFKTLRFVFPYAMQLHFARLAVMISLLQLFVFRFQKKFSEADLRLLI